MNVHREARRVESLIRGREGDRVWAIVRARHGSSVLRRVRTWNAPSPDEARRVDVRSNPVEPVKHVLTKFYSIPTRCIQELLNTGFAQRAVMTWTSAFDAWSTSWTACVALHPVSLPHHRVNMIETSYLHFSKPADIALVSSRHHPCWNSIYERSI